MTSPRRPYKRAACGALAAIIPCLAAVLLSSHSLVARAASVGRLRNQIGASQGRVSSLAGAVGALSSRLANVHSNVVSLQAQLATIQADLDAKRAELLRLRTEQEKARIRLAQLIAYEQHAEAVLAQQLVGSYESDRPDLISVVLESTGFQDLLERLSFAQRIRKQDVQVVSAVKAARRAVTAQAIRLGKLEARQQVLTEEVLAQHNRVASIRLSLIEEEIKLADARRVKAGQLGSARAHLANLRGQLSTLEAAQAAAAAAAAARAAGQSSGSSPSSAPVFSPVSRGGFAFPLPKGSASPPGSWSLDQGVDISAPGDTPEYAVCSGTIVAHGIGGFGPWAPVLACDSSVGGYSYVYYGHAGPANQLPIGTHVSAGEVMSSVGPGIVGISTGPHLEIGFCDSSGSPIGPGTAGTMLSLLQGSY